MSVLWCLIKIKFHDTTKLMVRFTFNQDTALQKPNFPNGGQKSLKN